MNEKQAKRQLAKLLRSYTSGSVLHLLADLHRDTAEKARRADDAVTYGQHKLVEQTLVVVGMGVDAALPA
jgi:phosphoglycerate dehydrogenase-like enzyme